MNEAAFSSENKDESNPEADVPLSEKAEKYLRALVAEKNQMPPELTHAIRLLQNEIDSIVKTGDGRIKHRFLDLFHNRASLVSSKIGLPTKEFPKFNFVGKLLGPKGNTLKRLQEETKCRMVILGRGSIRDKEKEEALRNSNDRKFLHLLDEIHVEVTAFAQPAEAHARMAYGLAELRKYIIPDNNDEIAEQQARELGFFPFDEGQSQEEEFYSGQNESSFSSAPSHRGGGGGGGGGGSGGGSESSGLRGWGMQRGRRGAVRGRGSTRGSSIGSGSVNRINDEMQSMGGRGRGGNSNSGRGRDDYYDSGYSRGDNSGGNNHGFQGYDNGGGGYSGGDDYDDSDYSRRGNFKDTSFGQESGRGQWKQRGGVSRFGERSAPYSRRN